MVKNWPWGFAFGTLGSPRGDWLQGTLHRASGIGRHGSSFGGVWRFSRSMDKQDKIRCYRCKEDLPREQFHRNRSKKRGVADYCKRCMSAAVMASHRKNRERLNKYRSEWEKANRDRTNEYTKKWRKSDKGNAFFEKHKDRIREQKLQSQKRNPEAHRRSERNRRARKAAVLSTLTAEQWAAVVDFYEGHCAYCFDACEDPTMDHVVPIADGGSHSEDNVVPACRPCNSAKGSKPLLEWLDVGVARED